MTRIAATYAGGALLGLCFSSACTAPRDSASRGRLIPSAAFVRAGAVQRFVVREQGGGSASVSPVVAFEASGGTITKDGLYTAGRVPGSHHVIATWPSRERADSATVVIVPAESRTYTTTFPIAEWPISEDGRWVSGGQVGQDWTDVSTSPGQAIGHQVGAHYTDGTALMAGAWRPNQQAMATVFSNNQKDECFQEVELRLRSRLSPHQATGYEVLFKASKLPEAYAAIVRWNGPVGDFTLLTERKGPDYGVATGDVIRASIVGSTIAAFKNDILLMHVTDTTFAGGAPGVGFNLVNELANCVGTNGDYGFSDFSASELP